MTPRIFIIDDESSICVSLALALEPEYSVSWETNALHALDRLQLEAYDLVLLDMVIGEHNGIDILVKIRQTFPHIPVIIMTAYGNIRSSVDAMARGAFTYLTKPLDLEELKIYMQQALEFQALNDNVGYLNSQLEEQLPVQYLIGTSAALKQVLRMIDKFRDEDSNVLITGESGTGKSLVAQALHNPKRRKRFVCVNCAAIDPERLEEVFFGYKKGAFPGASYDQRGKLDYANQGTLYLDGIGDMPPAFQAKLLWALQNHTFTPLGGRDVHRFDGRVIVSTNQNLDTLVESGRLRRDLLYRLNTVEIHMPPLRDRREDIPLLCEYFIRTSAALQGKACRVQGITQEALSLLYSHDYPGNVRELNNTIEYAGIIASGEWIQPKDLPYRFTSPSTNTDDVDRFLAGKTLEDLEHQAILSSFQRHGGKRSLIAAELGISPRGLWNKLKEYGLQ